MTSRCCGHDHIPNAATEVALWDGRVMDAKRIIRNLLEHAVYDRDHNDECGAAVDAAEAFLGGAA